MAAPNLEISNQQFSNEALPRLSAQMSNLSTAELASISVVAVLSNAQKNAIAVSSTFVERLAPGERRQIVFTWPQTLKELPVAIDFYPRVNLMQ
jgi:hypothetical protein